MISGTDLLEALPVAIYTTDADGRITFYNRAAAELWGHHPELGSSQWCGSWRLYWPDGRPLPHGECPMAIALKEGREVRGVEAIAERPDGTRVRFMPYPTPLRDPSGRLVGAINLLMDITDRHDADMESARLAAIVVSSDDAIISKTIEGRITSWNAGATRIFGFSSFTGRLQALAKAHTLLTRSKMQGADVMELVSEQVLIGAPNDNRISCSGPLLVLDAQAAVHLALVLHELATNARKYGALSVPYGRLSVTWQVRTNGGGSLLLSWKESNGPKVSAPSAHGFGGVLIEQTMRAHGGQASVEYRTDGLTCEIKLPLPEAARSGAGDASTPKTSSAPSLLAALSDHHTLHGKRIILIEDEPLVAMDVESTLTAAGCKVVGQAATLERAKQLIEEADCDAALVDVNLAGQPVDELATLLTRKNRPFAFVTGYGREALPAGFRGAVVLGKPFGADQLLATLEVLLYQPASVIQFRHKKV